MKSYPRHSLIFQKILNYRKYIFCITSNDIREVELKILSYFNLNVIPGSALQGNWNLFFTIPIIKAFSMKLS